MRTSVPLRPRKSTAAEVTPISEIGEYRFKPGKISETLLNDYMATVQPARKAAE